MTAVLRAPTAWASGTGGRWALTDCTLEHPGRARRRPGRPERGRQDHAAQPGRRPARADLRAPSRSSAAGRRPAPAQLAKVGFVAQDTPTYAGLSVADHLRLGARLNPRLGRARSPGTGSRSSAWTRRRRPGSSPAASAPSSP